jgi:hypothetical protein
MWPSIWEYCWQSLRLTRGACLIQFALWLSERLRLLSIAVYWAFARHFWKLTLFLLLVRTHWWSDGHVTNILFCFRKSRRDRRKNFSLADPSDNFWLCFSGRLKIFPFILIGWLLEEVKRSRSSSSRNFLNPARQVRRPILDRGRGAPNDNMKKTVWSSVAFDRWVRILQTSVPE